jgi:hypothetical protein
MKEYNLLSEKSRFKFSIYTSEVKSFRAILLQVEKSISKSFNAANVSGI